MDHSSKNGDEKSETGYGPTGAAISLLAIPIFYVALLGPVAIIHRSAPKPLQTMFETVYAPLLWLDQILPGQPFSEYVELWDK